MYIGQTVAPPLVLERQLLMIDPQQVQHRGLKIVHMHRILHDVVTEIVGFAISNAGLYATARHPDRKTTRMVIASVIICSEPALAIDR